jgi:hypothetical protein
LAVSYDKKILAKKFRTKSCTVVCIYKDTFYKDNMAEIWPKPTFFYFGPSLNMDNMAKIFKRVVFLKISIINLFFIKIWVKTKKKKSSYFLGKIMVLKLYHRLEFLLCGIFFYAMEKTS